ncbi:MAG: hypothetical protein JXA69_15895 [Phycisphaerae bacterium]|nr:hypothetical protein [Phycisphaerae bacterium]
MTMLAATILKGPDYFILTGYFVLMLAIGAYFFRFMRGMKDYFSGANRVPWWLSGTSFYMSSFSAFAFIFYSALAYKYGWVGVTLFWVSVPATLVSVTFFSARWRRARIDSPVEYLESRYSPILRQSFAWHGVVVRLFDDALKLIAVGTFLAVGLDIDVTTSMIASGLIILSYTFMGGLWAVIVTDFVQFVVLTGAIIVILPLSIIEAGGLASIIRDAPAGFFHLTASEFNWVYVGSSVVLSSLCYSALHWPLVQRYYCVANEKEARKVGWLVVILNIIGPPVMFFPAMAARSFLGTLTDEAQVYPLLCARLLPAGMFGLMVAAMFSATMSMLSSDYNVCANVLTSDVYRRYIRSGASQRELLLVGRITTVLVGLGSLGLALLLAGGSGEKQFRNMVTLFSTMAAPVAIPMLLGLVWKRATNAAALAGFLTGSVVGVVLFWWAPDAFVFLGAGWKRENLILVCTCLATLGPIVAVSRFGRTGERNRERTRDFFQRLATPIGGLTEDAPPVPTGDDAVISPFRVVGICVVFIGLMMLAIYPWIHGRLLTELNLVLGGLAVVIGGLMAWRGGREPPTGEA